ncbi:tRNA-uridine aminocarboxypropyltransferase [Stutzerimonas urumqiensis]|uniref:tRNA-uridine aminocarboxypropyltransferase n=1 Tax=Stutzerimonas urumqiensis TaxID=638269 RepID=UPI000EB3EBD9|nr:tRNA-uridine aminocarboxypropyltransferase [Stutzerimonas urumqiensis]
MQHAVARLRDERLARSLKPFSARGSRVQRCADCRVMLAHCFCRLKPQLASRAGFCLLMHDVEMLKPSNTGWLIADLVPSTYAFGWSRTAVAPGLLSLLSDPQWQPYVVFPGEYASAERVVERCAEPEPSRRPLFILLDATWTEARKMFRKSPYLNGVPVLSLSPDSLSRYRLRRSRRGDHLCTAEVAARCLELAGDLRAAEGLEAWLDVFSDHYLCAKDQRWPDLADAAHQRLARFSRSTVLE